MSANRKKLLMLVALTGAAVKLAEFLLWYNSAFRFYNFVPGLDMKTLLSFGEWGKIGNDFLFTPHRALVAAWWKLNGEHHFVPGIVAVQALFGILGAVLCADLALRLFDRDRISAFLCGIVYLLYGPFFIYEFSTLQEVVALDLILLAFHAAVRARGDGMRKWIAAGTAMGAALIGRPTALLLIPFLCLMILQREFRRGQARRIGRCAAGLFGSGAAVLLAVSLVNRCFGGSGSVFFNVLPYSLEFNSRAAPAFSGAAAGYPHLQMLLNAASRVPALFLPQEVPENLNWYFIADTLPALHLLIGPALLMPLAAAGLLLVLPRFRRPAGLILLPIVTLALPLCVRDPIGRYRLTLVPYFILAAGYWVHLLLAHSGKRRLVPLAAATLCFAAGLAALHPYHRGSDYLTHALALELENGGKVSPDSLGYLAEGWKKSGYRYNPLGVNLYLRLAESDVPASYAVLATGMKHSPEPEPYRYYLALRMADRGDFAGAEALLGSCRSEKLGFLQGKYFYLYGEMLRRRGDFAGAAGKYRKALEKLDAASPLFGQAKEALSGVSAPQGARRTADTADAPRGSPSRE